MEQSGLKQRLYFLDWLRVLAFTLLVFYHTGLIFVDWGFHIQNDSFSEWMKLPMLFVNQWRLPLLFFVSGAGIRFALGKRPPGMFVRERFSRIFIPFIFGILVVVPPQLYYEWLQHGKFTGTYLEFYPLFFRNFTWNHLWFLAYLFVFTFLALPLFLYLRGKAGIAKGLSSGTIVFLLIIPLLATEVLLRARWPDTRNLVSDWYNFIFYLLLMIYGYLFASFDSLWPVLEKERTKFLGLGLLSFGMIYFGWHQPGINFLEVLPGGIFIFSFFKCLNILCWILCSLGYSRRYLAENSAALQYANKAVYPFFILHQTVLIAIGFYVVAYDWNIVTKYTIIVTGTFILSLMLYELLIRRVGLIRFLFGVK